MAEFFADPKVQEQLTRFLTDLPFAIWETFYMTVISTFFAYLIGLPLGVLLVTGERGGVRPLPRPLMGALNIGVNLLRSVPFLILMVLVIPLSRLILNTSIGTPATIIPLVVAAFPFVARLVESSLRELDKGVLEAAQSMGASPLQIITKVMVPECRPSLLSGFTTAFITILGYGAMAGAIGGGGLGSMALNLGYQRRMTLVLWGSVIVLVILVQAFQSAGTALAVRSDRRISRLSRSQKRAEVRQKIQKDFRWPRGI